VKVSFVMLKRQKKQNKKKKKQYLDLLTAEIALFCRHKKLGCESQRKKKKQCQTNDIQLITSFVDMVNETQLGRILEL